MQACKRASRSRQREKKAAHSQGGGAELLPLGQGRCTAGLAPPKHLLRPGDSGARTISPSCLVVPGKRTGALRRSGLQRWLTLRMYSCSGSRRLSSTHSAASKGGQH